MSDLFTKWHAVGLLGSVALHLGAVAALGAAPVAGRRALGPTTVEFEVPPPPPPPPVAPPPPAPTPEVAPEPEVTEPANLQPAPSEPEPAAPEAAAEEPVELTGLTLTNEGPGDGWSSAVGNGRSLRGPLRKPTGKVGASTPRPSPATVPASVHQAAPAVGPALVPLASLSRRPSPPRLDGTLRANYPADARREGRAGTAAVTARIEADGHVRLVSVVSESEPGFGEACRRTVLGSVWSPPLDEGGRPAATEIRYTCEFRVER